MTLGLNLSERERKDYGESLRRIAENLDSAITEPQLDKVQTLRMIGAGLAALLGLAADLVDPPTTADDPRQGTLFPEENLGDGNDGKRKSKVPNK